MAKVLNDRDLLDIVRRAVEDGAIDDSDQYRKFLDDLALVITEHFGGEAAPACDNGSDMEPAEARFAVEVHLTADVPADGGVYANYDTDINWENGKEEYT